MSKIQERLNELRPHVVGIRYLQGIQLVDAIFNKGWTVPESKIIQVERVDGDENYYMFFSSNGDIDVDDLLDYVQEIIKLNIEREKKYELLKLKAAELQKIFQENTLSKLQKLRFTFDEPSEISPLIDIDKIDDKFETINKIDSKIVVNETEEFIETEPKEVKLETKIGEQSIRVNRNGEVQSINKINNIELPPKPGEKIELIEFEEPKIVCKCGPDDICPICEEEKF
jgi:hypothetical protein